MLSARTQIRERQRHPQDDALERRFAFLARWKDDIIKASVAAMCATSKSDLNIRCGRYLMVFKLVFDTAMSSLTRATQLVTASAAYCAVLVVFIGNSSRQIVDFEEV